MHYLVHMFRLPVYDENTDSPTLLEVFQQQLLPDPSWTGGYRVVKVCVVKLKYDQSHGALSLPQKCQNQPTAPPPQRLKHSDEQKTTRARRKISG